MAGAAGQLAGGRWRVEIETEDGRDIGIMRFDLVNDLSSGARSFLVDRH